MVLSLTHTHGDSPKSTSHSLVVHVWFVLVFSPKLGHCLGVDQFEDALLPLGPFDVPGTGVLVL